MMIIIIIMITTLIITLTLIDIMFITACGAPLEWGEQPTTNK